MHTSAVGQSKVGGLLQVDTFTATVLFKPNKAAYVQDASTCRHMLTSVPGNSMALPNRRGHAGVRYCRAAACLASCTPALPVALCPASP
jgi:hypothetical protein